MVKVRAGIVGSAGYTGGELIRLLLNHPEVDLKFVHSLSNAGNPVHEIHKDLLGETELVFDDNYVDNEVDVVFLCSGHGQSRKFLEENPVGNRVKIVDLSQDFRLRGEFNDRVFTYGLVEAHRSDIMSSDNVANPGCFATCIQLGILPLGNSGLLKKEIHVSAITGSTGAGQSLSPTSHFSWRNNNMSIYKAFNHQHLKEIHQSIGDWQNGSDVPINFIPYRGNFTRGIIASIYTSCDLSIDEANDVFESYYNDHPFTFVSKKNIDLKQVVNTNKCLLYLEKHDDKLLIVSIIDNLLKGAVGQAVQNMNLMFGLPETSGLKLKSVAF
jgi:N-acetyl-gamma-glutamyl-phosphate reductase